MSNTAPDRFDDAAQRLLAELKKFEIGALDDAVGDDQATIKQEVLAEWLRREFGK